MPNEKNIKNALFETKLAQVIVEYKALYEALYIKIALSIKRIIEANVEDQVFSRLLFANFSEIQSQYRGYNSIDNFIGSGFDLNAANLLHKMFFENLLDKITIDTGFVKADKLPTLVELTEISIVKNKELFKQLKQNMRPSEYFLEKNRGRIELDNSEEYETKKMGICTEQSTPENLKNYYLQPYIQGQTLFKCDPQASFYKELEENDLPFVGGTSGTLEICFTSLIQLDTYSKKELALYFMVLAASMVARGHHSFYEVMIVAKTLGFKIEHAQDKKMFYEQFLTKEFIESQQYQAFIQSTDVIELLDEYQGSKNLLRH